MRILRVFLVMAAAGCVAQAAEPEAARRDGGAADGGRALLIPPNVGKGQLLTDVTKDPDRPRLPKDLTLAGTAVWGLFKVCVKTDGVVADVRVIKSADWRVDPSWMATIKRWRYRPFTIDGKPVPFCYPMRLEVRTAR
jgi:Gram-negative bacterial TonB protein C-terminal